MRDLRERLAKFAESNRRRRGEGKPETFDFFGFTHMCGRASKSGAFIVRRKTAAKKMRAKLQAIKQQFRRRMHEPLKGHGQVDRRFVKRKQ